MILDHLTNNFFYEQPISGLDLLTTSDSLISQLKSFLLSCRVEGLSPTTLKNYGYHLRSFATFCLEVNQTDVKHITSQHIRLFLIKLQEHNNAVSVGNYYKTIKRFFNWLIAEGLLKNHPMQNIKLPKRESKIVKPFSREDIDNLLLLCSSQRFLDLRNKAIILVFWDTGLRLFELANIQLKDINFDQETIKVMGKGAKERVVRIGKATQKALLRYLLVRKDTYPCLWVTEECKPMTAAGIQVTIKKLCHRAEITDAKCGPHTFRHTFGTQALRNGADIREVQSLLGHSTLKTTLVYVATVNSEDAIKSHRRFSPVDNFFIK